MATDKSVSEPRELVLHLGLPKTATTTLQRGLFAVDPKLAYLGKRSSNERANRVSTELVQSLVWCTKRYWKDKAEHVYRELEAARGEIGVSSGPLLVSHEDLLGCALGVSRVCSRFDMGRQVGSDPERLADNVEALGRWVWPGRIRLLVTIRRQDTFLASLFAQTFLWRYATAHNTFERFTDALCDREFYSAGGIALDYDWLLARLGAAVGSDNVHALVYEDLAHAPARVSDTIHRVLGIDHADTLAALGSGTWKVRSTDQRSWRVQRFRGSNPLRHAVQRLSRRARKLPNPKRLSLTEDRRRWILDVYADSNRRLAERDNLPLADYGYY